MTPKTMQYSLDLVEGMYTLCSRRMIAGCTVEKGRLPNSLSKLLNGQWGDLAL